MIGKKNSIRSYLHLLGMWFMLYVCYLYLFTYNISNEISISDDLRIVLQLYDGIHYWSRNGLPFHSTLVHLRFLVGFVLLNV